MTKQEMLDKIQAQGDNFRFYVLYRDGCITKSIWVHDTDFKRDIEDQQYEKVYCDGVLLIGEER